MKSTKVVGGDRITDEEAARSWLLPWWSCFLHWRFPIWKLRAWSFIKGARVSLNLTGELFLDKQGALLESQSP